ncbi:hypothetical protein JHL21_05320 [Devosia sp. WQ 349]|uniref:hypothetical protein n=1 Tax=Devosia sp. WQ 349K1 TaxID=2800329 RepID=UPI0019076231|nr:hypothetical protein [Devosia sp. WQ 349K1]MBK1793913.1 hypothetical protein [Devosia sp. WQ 349K1]
MPLVSQHYFRIAVIFLIIGICFGLYMSISTDHRFTGAHAHLNLVGWVTSALFGIYFALNPSKATGQLVRAQFWIFVIGVVIMTLALALLLAGNAAMVPLVAGGSMITFVGVLLFSYIVWRN